MKAILSRLVECWFFLFFVVHSNAQNLLTDGGFTTTTSITPFYTYPVPYNKWSSWQNSGTSMNAAVESGVCHYSIYNGGSSSWEVQLVQWGFQLQPYMRYRLTFDVKADANRSFGVFLGEDGGGWFNFNNANYYQNATTSWQTKTMEFDVTKSFFLYKLSFEMGGQNTGMYFDNGLLEKIGAVNVVIAGNFQSELGCSSDWMPDCNTTALTYSNSTGLYSGTFTIPQGCYQYKVTAGGSWAINYGDKGIEGGANIYLGVPTTTAVTFSYDPVSHLVTTSPFASGFSTYCLPQVVLAGSMQSELGCGYDWDPACINSKLTYNTLTGLFEGTLTIPAGCYEYRVVENGDWVTNYGNNGNPGDPNYLLSVPGSTTQVTFTYDPVSHIVKSLYNNSLCLPNKVVLAGSMQSELGCSGDWQADCSYSELFYNPEKAVYESDLTIPKGCYEYRVVLNGDWGTNYGQWGSMYGPNYVLSLPVKADVVHFAFNPYSNIVTSSYNATVCQPPAVTIAGSFQSELGCSGDWQADCSKTDLQYDPLTGTWVDTFLLPAGNYEFKVTIDHSWIENYGQYGVRDGSNYTLDICFPSQVVFRYNHNGHWVSNQLITNGVCISKFYDPNVNGYADLNEQPMQGIRFTLTGNGITQTTVTNSNGKTYFAGIPNGIYTVRETVPAGYYSTVGDSMVVYVYDGMASANFGNVCLGAGGAKGMGYWMNKQGEAALKNVFKIDEALWQLRSFNLLNADGSAFDPVTFTDYRNWLQTANAKNMSHMLSAQFSVMYLNILMGYVDDNRFVYAPGCGFWSGKFMRVADLIWYTNYYLQFVPVSTGNNPDRSYLECLKDALDHANNNLTFVQMQPCGPTAPARVTDEPVIITMQGVKVWPNPSSSAFTVRFTDAQSDQPVLINVMDVTGKQVYAVKGFANTDFRFGEEFKPGIYLLQLMRGTERSTIKLVKQ